MLDVSLLVGVLIIDVSLLEGAALSVDEDDDGVLDASLLEKVVLSVDDDV